MRSSFHKHPYQGLILASSLVPIGMLGFFIIGILALVFDSLFSVSARVSYAANDSYGLDPLSGIFRLSCLCVLALNAFLYFRHYLRMAAVSFVIPLITFLILASTFFDRIKMHVRTDSYFLRDFFPGESLIEITLRYIPITDYLFLAWLALLFTWNLVCISNRRRSMFFK
jgi:hypothetical protein